MAIQQRNADLVNLLGTDFVFRNESNYSWGSAISSFMMLDRIRALWISNGNNDNSIDDISSHNNGLYSPNSFTKGTDILGPYVELDGATQYHSYSGQVNQQDVIFISGVQTVGLKPQRIYNAYGKHRGIARVGLSVDTAPTGADIIVDVLVDGVTIFTTAANRPRIVAGQLKGESSTIEAVLWSATSVVQVQVIQVGSGVAGSNLSVSIGHYGDPLNFNATDGMTVGGWFYFDSFPAELINVWNTTINDRSFKLSVSAGGFLELSISSNGVAVKTVTYSEALVTGQWYFLAGRFDPGVTMSLQVNDNNEDTVAAIPAVMNFSQNTLLLAGRSGATYLNGKWSIMFFCADYLHEDVLSALYYNSGAMLGGLQDE